jgi:hypothetical protein
MAVNLSPVGGVAAQFFDNDGNVLSGGKIFTYTAGTSTPAVTYTNASGAIAHSNPIILDSAGRVPSGEIWLTDGIQYKFVIKNASDVLIGTYDNIIGINSNFLNFLAEQEIQTATANQTVFTLTTTQYQPGTNTLSVFVDGVNQYGPGAQYAYTETSSTVVTFTNGLHVGASVKFTTTQALSGGAIDSSLVTYDPPFTGSVITNVESKLSQSVSVIDFGADPTGTADSTTAIQNALSQSNVVTVPKGTYRCDGCIVLTNNKTLIVEGKLIRKTANSASTRPVVKLFGQYVSLFGFGPSSIIESENASPLGVVLWGSESPTTEYVAFRWVNVKNLSIVGAGPTGTNKGLALYNSQFYIGGALYDGHFSDLWIFNCRTSVYLNPISNGNTFHNLNIWNTEGSIVCDGVVGGLVTDNNFSNLFTDNSPNQSAGVYARYTSHSNFVNMNGEPGASGRLCDIDNTCSRLSFIGVDNYVSPPSFSAGLSFYSVNGDIRSTDITGTNISSTNLTMTGGTTTFQDSASVGSYNRLRVQPSVAAFGGAGGVALLPGNVPGSGTVQFWTYFKDQVAGAGTTKHNVAIDGQQRAASFGITSGASGASGTFTTVDSKTVTVVGGIITAIV